MKEDKKFRIGYVAYYDDGGESDSPEWHEVESLEEALRIAWRDRVEYPDGLRDKPMGVTVYDESFQHIVSEGDIPPGRL